jgi:hypothetical protein
MVQCSSNYNLAQLTEFLNTPNYNHVSDLISLNCFKPHKSNFFRDSQKKYCSTFYFLFYFETRYPVQRSTNSRGPIPHNFTQFFHIITDFHFITMQINIRLLKRLKKCLISSLVPERYFWFHIGRIKNKSFSLIP